MTTAADATSDVGSPAECGEWTCEAGEDYAAEEPERQRSSMRGDNGTLDCV